VRPALFHPLSPDERDEARRKANAAPGEFVFLHVSDLAADKHADVILRAFARVLESHPTAKLIVKSRDDLYAAQQRLRDAFATLPLAEAHRVEARLVYFGQLFQYPKLARLNQVADAFLRAHDDPGESHQPSLEAAACGAPVLSRSNVDDLVQHMLARIHRPAREDAHARIVAERHGWTNSVRRLLDVMFPP
jgi:glycosyltransferase involved in cell wall biosynthesis